MTAHKPETCDKCNGVVFGHSSHVCPKPTAPRVLSEARNATRSAGRFAAMDKCQVCEKPGTLEPAFGGDDSDPRVATDLAWGKLICPRCVRAAAKRIGT